MNSFVLDDNIRNTLDIFDSISFPKTSESNRSDLNKSKFVPDSSVKQKYIETEVDKTNLLKQERYENDRKDKLISVYIERIEQLQKELEFSNEIISALEEKVETLQKDQNDRSLLIEKFEQLQFNYQIVNEKLNKPDTFDSITINNSR